MRLRPSGRSGPVATSVDAFASYQENEAWTWEHMALTRARVVSGPPAFANRVEGVIRSVLTRKRDPASVAADGKAIVLISSYLPELTNTCDRIVVVCDGRTVGEMSRNEFDEERIMALASGVEREAA